MAKAGTAAKAGEQIPASVKKWLKDQPKKLLIDGKWVGAASGKTFDSLNPANEEVVARVAEADKEDVERAYQAARRAFDQGPWPRMTPAERTKILLRIADLIEENGEEIATLETLDNGKPIFESKIVDIPQAASTFRYYAGWATKIYGETSSVSAPGEFFTYTLREPVGVCGQIIPWNFPLLMAAWKLAPALACGNVCILKPAEQTPLSAIRLGELMLEAGVPEGAVNILPGYGPTAGAAISGHMGIDKVAFTGEYITGREIIKASAGNLKRVSLELGGKAPNIVFADADSKAAVRGALTGIFFNQGQVCCAGSRLFVEEKVYEEFTDQMSTYASGIKQGPGIDPGTRMGPLVSKDQLDRVTGYLDTGKGEGARAKTGGERNTDGDLAKGYFVKPTVFTNVRNDMRIAREEIFGPVVAAIPFKDVNEVIAAGNDTTYGLSAGIWTRDIKKAHRAAKALRAGTVWINCFNVFDANAAFGGCKQSGYGREQGIHGLELYTQIKSVWVDLN